MRELVVISGKGGTGKTSVLASLAALASAESKCVLADCDVDAADLHLLAHPEIERIESFFAGSEARVDSTRCTSCGRCAALCRFQAIHFEPDLGVVIDPIACEGCGLCQWNCPAHAITMVEPFCGQWFSSQTRWGPMIHASLLPGSDNSGKLVHTVKKEAKEKAQAIKADWLLVDGSPGIGCPVIASISAADMVLIVTEPTLSGLSDLQRVAKLADHFSIPAAVCINKVDINLQIADTVTKWAAERSLPVVGWIQYEMAFSDAQRAGQTLVDFSESPAAGQIRLMWDQLPAQLGWA